MSARLPVAGNDYHLKLKDRYWGLEQELLRISSYRRGFSSGQESLDSLISG
jgi:hypothetical protein